MATSPSRTIVGCDLLRTTGGRDAGTALAGSASTGRLLQADSPAMAVTAAARKEIRRARCLMARSLDDRERAPLGPWPRVAFLNQASRRSFGPCPCVRSRYYRRNRQVQ